MISSDNPFNYFSITIDDEEILNPKFIENHTSLLITISQGKPNRNLMLKIGPKEGVSLTTSERNMIPFEVQSY